MIKLAALLDVVGINLMVILIFKFNKGINTDTPDEGKKSAGVVEVTQTSSNPSPLKNFQLWNLQPVYCDYGDSWLYVCVTRPPGCVV